ncbi:hypothetical protein WJX74_008994 [Apatococcus lobatus]|uniref:Protein phosphatase n=2 Tax=Apatococcus TaxID=904362 RepID=A0AAW1SPK7_9CHLO
MAGRLLKRQASLHQFANRFLHCAPSSIFTPHLAPFAFVAPPLYEPGCTGDCEARDLRQSLPDFGESFASAAALAEVAQQDSSEDPHVQLTAAGRYALEFFTGDVRGAGTPCPATIRLVGTEGESQDFVLGDNPEEPGFRRGESISYELEVDEDLGDLRSIFVRQANPSDGVGWYLEKIQLRGLEGVIEFPCHAWLGKDDAGDFNAAQERNLIPCGAVHLQEAIAEKLLEQPLSVHASGMSVAHPEKAKDPNARAVNRKHLGWGGEDAYFYDSRPGISGLGVADGVYMWKEQGIDSGRFSKSLMSSALQAVRQGAHDVLTVLKSAHKTVQEDEIQGSSTICLVTIDTRVGRLNSANLGDSGFLVLGKTPVNPEMHLKYRSPQQEHQFGCPYQLGHEEKADKPRHAMLATVPLMPNDVVVLGSDGLFDNMDSEQILEDVKSHIGEHKHPSAIAQHLVSIAYNNSMDRDLETPYSLAATEAFDMIYTGGKPDDITVVVAELR